MYSCQTKVFKSVLMVFLGLLSLAIYPLSSNDEVLYSYDGISTLDEDGLQLTKFKILGPSPWKAGDSITVKFDLKNITHKTIYFSRRGIFVGCLNPMGVKEDFGHQFKKKSLIKGETVHFTAAKKLGQKGTWTFWPSYYLGSTRWVNHRSGYGPYKWQAAKITPTTIYKDSKFVATDLSKASVVKSSDQTFQPRGEHPTHDYQVKSAVSFQTINGNISPGKQTSAFVIVGNNGTVFYTSDPTSGWQAGHSGTTADLHGAAANGFGRWLAVGSGGTVIYSTDGGATWTAGDLGSQIGLRSVVYAGNGRWVAVGLMGKAFYSTDGGDSWTAGTPEDNWELFDVAVDTTGRLVTVGFSNTANYSTDGGENWVAGNVTLGWIKGVAYGHGKFILVGPNAGIRYSVDGGANWHSTGPSRGPALSSVAYGDGTWMAVGAFGGIYYYNEGQSWSRGNDYTLPNSNTRPNLIDVAYGDGSWIIVGENGVIIYKKNDGMGWISQNTYTSETLRGIAHFTEAPGSGPGYAKCLFCENFEDGDWLGWGDDGGGYTISVVPTSYYTGGNNPGGTYALSLTSDSSHWTFGIFRLLNSIQPNYIKFYVRAATTSEDSATFKLSTDKKDVISFRLDGSAAGGQQIVINGKQCGSYSAKTWYLVEFKNIDWHQNNFDVYIDGVLKVDDLSFLVPAKCFTRLDLYNDSADVQAWFDDIALILE